MLRRLGLIVALVLLPLGGAAQERADTLADIRQELSVLFIEIQRLKQELSTTSGPSGSGGGSTLDRVNAIEAQVQSLTSKTEELEFRINAIVRDGTNRIGDLEFRLVELEGGDLSTLGETSTLGGEMPAATPVAPSVDTSGLTVAESADFKAAETAFIEGRNSEAVDGFTGFIINHPTSPLLADAQFLKGQAHEALGEMRAAARSYLDAYSMATTGERAPDALFKLGTSLAALGQSDEACVTLGEVGNRFPGSEAAGDAELALKTFGCS